MGFGQLVLQLDCWRRCVGRCIRPFLLLVLASGAGAAAFSAAAGAATEERLQAAWKPRELTFTYMGFTSRYSCEGLLDQLQQVLLALGARGDLIVTSYACSRAGRPESAPALRIKATVLQAAASSASGDTVEARWKTVRLAGPGRLSPGDCELAEQIRDMVLPLFTTRNLHASLGCIPHQEAGNIELTVDVLVPAAVAPTDRTQTP